MHFRQILPCLLLVIALFASAVHADDAADREQDTTQMKRVWEALMAFKKAKGKLPDQISEIVPEFLPNPKDLISPRDTRPSAADVQPDGHMGSYHYEWGIRKWTDLTLTEIRNCQLEEFGSVVPLLRCIFYAQPIHVSHAGDVYESAAWETDPAVQELAQKRGLGPGATTGKFLELIAVDLAGAPVGGLKVTVDGRYVADFALPQRTLATDDQGRVRIPFGPTRRMHGTLDFEKPGYFAFAEKSAAAGFADTLRVSVSRTKVASGIVTDARGKPIADATVHLARKSDEKSTEDGSTFNRLHVQMNGRDRIGSTRTGSDGKWKIDNLPDDPGLDVQCTVSHPEYAVKVQVLDRAALARCFAGKARVPLAEPFQVRGKITDPDGKPAADAQILLLPPADPASPPKDVKWIEAKSDTDGEFNLRARISGDTRIAVLPKSGAAPTLREINVSPETPSLTIPLTAGRMAKGKIVNFHKKPVAGVRILFTGWDLLQYLPVHPIVATTDAEGNWQWEHAPQERIQGRALLASGLMVGWRERGENIGNVNLTIPTDDEQLVDE